MAKAKKRSPVSIHRPAKRLSKPKAKPLDPKKDFNVPAKRLPRQGRLKGMEDSPIKDLEDAALEHSETQTEIRTARVELKRIDDNLAALMKRLGKKSYNHKGIRLKLREGTDKVSVQVKRHDAEDENQEQAEEPPAEIGGDEEGVVV